MFTHFLCRVIVAVGLAGFAIWPASAYTILPPNSVVAGQSIADWTAAWWSWAWQSPAASYPPADPNGIFANQNNNGPVFFVAGTTGTTTVATRSFNVPFGRPLLIPMINFADTEPAEIQNPPNTLAEREAIADSIVTTQLGSTVLSSLFVSVDGNPVANPAGYLEEPGFFSAGLTPAGSYIQALAASFGLNLPTGADLFPTKAAGYWVMVDGLSLGKHELHFGGSSLASSAGDAFSNDVTDTINVVVPEPDSAFLVLIGLLSLSVLLSTRIAGGRARFL